MVVVVLVLVVAVVRGLRAGKSKNRCQVGCG